MTDVSTQQRPTPNRRRRGKNQVQHSVQKAYASENDVAGFESSHYGVAPQTPSKTSYTSPGPKSNQATNGKQRVKNKTARQKNAGTTTSPEPDHPNHHATTPQRPVSLKPAFAGATFHASPAPSALPIPSFLAKPRDSPAAQDEEPVPVQQQPSPPTTDNELPTPHRPSPAAKMVESPLDFMFRAHRQEKERERHGQSPNIFNTATPPSFSSPLAPKTTSQPPTRSTPVNRASHGIDYDELNGTSGQPVGPAFSTPYQDRIRAARSGQDRPSPIQHQPASNEPIEDPTEALKKFLFSGNMTSPTNPSPLRATPPAPVHSHAGFSPRPAPVNGSPRAGHQAHSIQAMENDLRRILKLDNAVDSPSTERRLFTQ